MFKKLIISIFTLLICSFANASELDIKFSKKSEREKKMEDIQRNRFHNRIDRINKIIESIHSYFQSNEQNIKDKELLYQELILLADEYSALYSVSIFDKKTTKKIKNKGYKIEQKLLKLAKRIKKSSFDQSKKKWDQIHSLIDEIKKIIHNHR